MNRQKIVFASIADVKRRPLMWSGIFCAKCCTWIAWVAFCVYKLCFSNDLIVTLALQLLLGAAFAHGVELQHQALHQSGFRSRRLSRIFGVALGLPMLVSYSSYQDSHLYHHSKLGTPEDLEFFDYGDKEKRSLMSIFKHFFLINHFCDFLKRVIDSLNGSFLPTRLLSSNAIKMRFEYILIACAFFGLALTASHFHSNLFVKCWLIPLFVFAAPIHALIELPEHFECDKTSGDAFQNTRTVKTHALVTWFTNGNNYHVEHHWVASLPIEKLSSLHREIEGKISNLSSSYTSFYVKFFSNLLFGVRESKVKANLDGG